MLEDTNMLGWPQHFSLCPTVQKTFDRVRQAERRKRKERQEWIISAEVKGELQLNQWSDVESKTSSHHLQLSAQLILQSFLDSSVTLELDYYLIIRPDCVQNGWRKCNFFWLTFSKEEVSFGNCMKTGCSTMYGQKVKWQVSVSDSSLCRDK